ncbi:MAG TPA: phospholipase D-like domain-containing protein, partial [bacterium]|nr:phospholipase D-like domain-containing protein [bacterium]
HNSLYSLPLNLLNQAPPATNRYAKVKLLTEQRVKLAILDSINKLESGDELKIASNYLSDQAIISALLASADKGVLIQVLLDPTKTSLVNLASAEKLRLASHRSIKLKWASAATAQMIIARSKADKQMTVIAGSSSLTRRDLDNYNLQSNLALVLNTDWKLAADFDDYFASAWQAGTEYSTNESLAWYLPYLLGLQEWTGMGSF